VWFVGIGVWVDYPSLLDRLPALFFIVVFQLQILVMGVGCYGLAYVEGRIDLFQYFWVNSVAGARSSIRRDSPSHPPWRSERQPLFPFLVFEF
jgi:hypothetical protein